MRDLRRSLKNTGGGNKLVKSPRNDDWLTHMRTVNRSIAIIRPKSPFIKWANTLSGDFGYDSDDSTVFLIPSLLSIEAVPTNTMGWRYINAAWDDIFKEMLGRWEASEWTWPRYRTRQMFGQWFKVEFHSLVIDAVGKE